MRLQYGTASTAYLCGTRHQRYGEPLCQSLTIDHVDRAVIEAFLQVIGPAQMEAALALAEDLERDRIAVERQWELRLERAHYEVERAFWQYDLCEPENRLAGRELDRRWNEKLRALAELDVEYRREQDRGLMPLTEDEKGTLRQLVGNVRVLWEAVEMPIEDRKRLVRCLIREVVLLKDEQPRGQGGITTIRIGWCSGTWSELRDWTRANDDRMRMAMDPAIGRLMLFRPLLPSCKQSDFNLLEDSWRTLSTHDLIMLFDHCVSIMHVRLGRKKSALEAQQPWSADLKHLLDTYREAPDGEPIEGDFLCSGIAASGGRVTGIARVVPEPDGLDALLPGEILVTRFTRPELVPYFRQIRALVTDEGGTVSHAAIMAREFGLPP